MNSKVKNTDMGKVVVTMRLTNWADTVLSERGFIPVSEVRSVTLNDVLVDTGATRICLPADAIEQLGLTLAGTVDAQIATGLQTLNVYKGLEVDVEGREGRYDCVELPIGQTPLLGLIALEDMGLDPDLQNQKLRHLPMRGKETYVTVL